MLVFFNIKKELIHLVDKNMDFTRLSEDEKINGIKITNVPQYIREKAYLTDFSETLAQLAEMIIQLGVNLGLDPDDALEWARKLQESVSQSEFDSWVATLLDGGPSLFFETKAALLATYPNGAPGVALVRETDPAKIYVWNGSAWEDFGDYQGIEIRDGAVTAEKVADGAITPSKIDEIGGESLNILNLDTLLTGKAINSTNGKATLTDNANWSVNQTPYPVKQWDLVRFNKAFSNNHYYGVDASGNILQSGNASADGNQTITVASGVVGFYSNVLNTNKSTAMITVNNEMPTTYTPFGTEQKQLMWLSIAESNLNESLKTKINSASNVSDQFISDWKDKTMISAGDSITWQDGRAYSGTSDIARGWQTVVKERLELASVKNIAVSGKPMSDGTTAGGGTVTTVLAETAFPEDLFVIPVSTNDFKLNVPIGELKNVGDVFDRNTFYGAYQTTIEYILSKRKDIRIVLFTPLHRNNSNYDSTVFTNAAGHKLIDYVEAIKQIGARYSIPVCDMYSNSGINMLTLDVDTRDGLHPNDVGYAKMGRYASKFIDNL